MAFNQPVNLEAVYVSALCISLKKVFKTREEAQAHADSLECVLINGDHWECGYVIEYDKGSLSESIINEGFMCPVTDEDGGDGYGRQSFNYLEIPEWLEMGNLATARPKRIKK